MINTIDTLNLVYNPDMSNNADGWVTNSNLIYESENDCINVSGTSAWTGDIETQYIPCDYKRKYHIECDIFASTITRWNTVYINCYDYKKSSIGVNTVTHAGETTLAQDLNNGDTVVYLKSVYNWYTTQTYRYVGICDDPSCGYNKAVYEQKYDSSTVDNTTNTVTLQSAWTGGTWKAGTQVAAFTDGGTWLYPISFSSTNTSWVHYSGNFTPRYGTQWIRIGIIKYADQEFKYRNFSISCVDYPQYNDYMTQTTYDNYSITKEGLFNCLNINEDNSIKVRYIRDYLNGNSVDSNNYWLNIKAYDKFENNVALSTNGSCSSSCNIVNAKPDNTSNSNMNKFHYITKDELGKLTMITADTDLMVSEDGKNWITVFDSDVSGSYTETEEGHYISLNRNQVQMYYNGETKVTEIYEI